MPDTDIEPLWTGQQTADYLDVTLLTLHRWRVSGDGPPFIIVKGKSRFRYRPSAVVEWLKEREASSMATHHATNVKRAIKVAKQREILAHARETRWPRKHEAEA
jgi:hypothetical protein